MSLGTTVVECPVKDVPGRQINFLIMDAPSPSSLGSYIKEMKSHNVHHLVRVCAPTYNAEIVERAGIKVHYLPFDDGAAPKKEVLDKWLELVDATLETGTSPTASLPPAIAVHCVAGLGRAPILVAVALIEYTGMQALDVVELIRERRHGAINSVQLSWIMKYHKRGGGQKCVIS